MATSIAALLRECHRLQKHLRDLKQEIERGPRVLKAQQNKLAQEEQRYKDSFEIIKKLKLEQKENEGNLKQTEALLEKLFKRSMEVTTMKEMEANKHEMEIANKRKGELEDAILTSMTEIEERTASIPNVEKEWKTAQEDFSESQKEAKERLERLLEDQKLSLSELAKFEAQLPEHVAGPYHRLIKGYGPDGLASVVGRVCQQCRVTLTEEKVGMLMDGAFVSCSICGRALYPAT